MSSSNPPYPNFNGITYNGSFFSSTSGGLTQDQANLLYLRKTVADTATAQEAFSAGIKTDSIIANTATAIAIGNNDPVNIGFGNSRPNGQAINIGGGSGNGNINLGSLTQTVRIGGATDGLNYTYNSINPITPGNDFQFMTTQDVGILNIATGSRTAVGAINIGSGIGLAPIKIDTGNTGNTNAIPAISIGTSATSKTIKLGNTGNSIHCSSVDLTSSGINNIANTSGDLSIANLQTSGILNLGTNTSRTSNINIGTGATGPFGIYVGNVNSTTTLNGPLTLSKPLNLGSGPTLSSQLGFMYSASVNNIAASASPWNVLNIAIAVPGIYIFALELQATYGAIAQFQIELTGTNVPQSNFGKSDLILGSVLTSAGTVIVNCSASTYYMKATFSASLSNVFANVNAVRIA